MSNPFVRTALACAVMGYSTLTWANEKSLDLDDLVVTASGFEQKITEAPASVSVISNKKLTEMRYSNLAQALEDVEGVDVRQSTGKTGGLNISIRGLPSEYTLILIDGRRQNDSGNVTPNGFNDTATSFMPPLSAIERIEVIRGPMSTLYGSDAMGGVVNIITKKVASEWSSNISLDHTFQENKDYGTARNATFYTSGPLIEGLLGLNLRGSIYDRSESDLKFDNDSSVSKRGVSPVEGKKHNFGARLNFTPNADNDIGLDFEHGRQHYNNDDCQLGTLDGVAGGNAINGCTTPDVKKANGYKDKLRFERNQFVVTHVGRYELGTLDSSLTHKVTETFGRTIPGSPIGNSYTGYPSIVIGSDRKLKNTDLVLDSKFTAEYFENHISTIGGQWLKAKMTDGIASEDFEQKSWALFLEDEWRLRDDLALTLGGRYEDHQSFGGHMSPRAYLVWNTTDNWTIKGGVSRGYKTPSLNDLHNGINGVTGQGRTITIGSPHLKPEKSTSTEVGFYYDNYEDFNANATIFHTKFTDKIENGTAIANCYSTSNPNQQGCVSFGPGFTQESFSQKINVGKATSKGLELGARWGFATDWSISGNYTYSHTRQDSGIDKGRPFTNTPRHMMNASLNWQTTDRLNMWLKGEYRSKRVRFVESYDSLNAQNKLVADAASNLKAYSVFQLGGSYKATENVTLTAAVYNLFNKDFTKGKYYQDGNDLAWVSDYTQSGAATSGTLEEGRRLWLSANLTF